MKYFTILLVLVGFVASLFMGFSDSDAFNGGGIVIEVPGQIMDISNNIISPGQTMVVNGTFNQSVDKFTASVFKNYEDSRKLVLTLSPSSDESGDFDFSFTIPDDWELGTYTILLENGLQFMDWKFTVRQNHSGGTLDRTVYPVPWSMSPLKQLYTGISPDEVVCNEGLSLYQKKNGLVACVSSETGKKLVQRDWAVEFPMKHIIDHRYWSKTYLVYHGMCAHIGVQQVEKIPDSIVWEMTLEDLKKIPIIKTMIDYNSRGLYSSSEYPITDTVVSDDVQNQHRQNLSEIKNTKSEIDTGSTFRYDGKYYQASFMIC